MALVNPNIAMSFKPTTEYQPRNALAEYAQVQQIMGGQRQAEMADMQLEALRRDRDALSQIQAAIVAKGGPPDLAAAADAMIKSGKPEYLTQGMAIRQKLADQALFANYQKEFSPTGAPAAAAPAAAPSALRMPQAPAPTNALGTGMFGMGMEPTAAAPVNAMAPAPVAPVNAMAAQPDIASLEARYRRVANIDTPGAKAEAALLLKQIDRASAERRLYTVPGVGLVDPTGRVIKPSAPTPTDLQRNYEFAKTPEGGNFRGSLADFKVLATPKTTVQLPPQEKSFEAGLGAGQSKRILDNQVAAQDAAEILRTNQVGRDLLKSGAITGTGADFIVGFNNALKQVGVDFGYADAAANSQAYVAALGANVGRIIKQFGAGTGLSNADRDYAAKIAGGEIALTEAALRKILDINDKASNRVIDLHNKNVANIKTNVPLTVEKPTFGKEVAPSAAAQIPGQAPVPSMVRKPIPAVTNPQFPGFSIGKP